jgi:hypothetical protein
MKEITNHDRISAHLFRYNYIRSDIEFDAPFEITQDGIAMGIGVSRGHSNIILRRMEENNEIIVGLSSIKDSNRSAKRKIYLLSEYGKNLFKARVKELKESGTDVEDLVKGIDRYRLEDIRRITGDRMDDLGCMAVLRVKVRKEDVPLESPLVPIIRQSYAVMKDSIRKIIITEASPIEIRRWHSKAADWCMDHDADIKERLHHLVSSFRDREAMRIARKQKYMLMDNPDQDLSDSLGALALRSERSDIIETATRIALEVGDLQMADDLSAKLLHIDPPKGRGLRCELLLKRSQSEEALTLARYHYNGDVDTGLVLGMCLLETSHFEDAIECLKRTKERMISEGCVFRLDELLMYEATAQICMREYCTASILIDAAVSFTRNMKRRASLLALKERAESEHSVLLQGIQV